MIELIIILAYIASVFLCRWIDIQYAWWKTQSAYKRNLNHLAWLLSVIYMLAVLLMYIDEKIKDARRDVKLNKFMQWFLISYVKETKKDRKVNNVLNDLFNKQ